MLSLTLCSFAGLIVGFIIGVIYKERRVEVVEHIEVPVPNINVEDVILLASTNNMAKVNALFSEYKVSSNLPVFYEKYLHLSKKNRDLYYEVLIEVLSKNKREYMSKLYEHSSVLAVSDLLLLLTTEMGLDNKTIARILGTNLEALKKRKNRLKAKIIQADLDAEFVPEDEEDEQFSEQPVLE